MVSYSDDFQAYTATGLSGQNADWIDVLQTMDVVDRGGGAMGVGDEVDGGYTVTGYDGVTWADDQSASVDTNGLPTTENNWSYAGAGPCVRLGAASSGNGYMFAAFANGGGNSHLLLRLDGGTPTTLDSAVSTLNTNATLKITAVGSTITCYIDDVEVLQATDATYASGRCGIGANNYRIACDNFVGEDIVASGAISGTASMALAATGTIAGAGALAGTAAMALSATGSLFENSTQPVAVWRSMFGIRRTSTSEKVTCIVEAYHQEGLGDVERVVFAVSQNGGAATTHSVTSRTLCYPDDTDFADPLTGSPASAPCPLWAYKYELLGTAVAAGYVDVTPTVYPTTGTPRTLATHRHYFDTDATDRRPCPGVRYVSSTGSNSNDGLTSGAPMLGLWYAIDDLQHTYGDCGGGTIYVMDDHTLTDYTYSDGTVATTTGDHWLTIAAAPGVARADVLLSQTSDAVMRLTGGTRFNLRVRDVTLTPVGIYASMGSAPHLWLEHCMLTTAGTWTGTGDVYLSWQNDAPDNVTNYVEQTAGLIYLYHTGCTYRGVVSPNVWGWARGLLIDSWWGAALHPANGYQASNCGHTNYETKGHRYHPDTIVGVFADFASAAIAVTNPAGTTFRYTVTNSTDAALAADFAELANSTKWHAYIAGCTNGGNNLSAFVTAGGADGSSHPYIEITNASGVAESAGASITLGIRLAADGQTWNSRWHSDVDKWDAIGSNIIVSNGRVWDWTEPLSFNASYATTDLAIVNIAEAGRRDLPSSGVQNCAPFNTEGFYGAQAQSNNVIVRDCTIWARDFYATYGNFGPGVELTDLILENVSGGTVAQIEGAAALIARVHTVIAAEEMGTTPSSGTAFTAADPGILGDFTLTANVGANGGWTRPAAWDTGKRGAWSNTATGDWSVDAPTGAISGTASMSLGASGTISGAGALAGTAAMALSATGAVAGAGALSGTAAMTLSAFLDNATDGPLQPAAPSPVGWAGPLPPAYYRRNAQTGPLPPADWQAAPAG